MGYWQAGFDVHAFDIEPQPHTPFPFTQVDVLTLDPGWLSREFDLVHLSPPCQGYTRMQKRTKAEHPLLIPAARELAQATCLPYVIENVEEARPHMLEPVQLCGSAFGLRVRRHRLFESNVSLEGTPCEHEWQDDLPCYRVYVGKSRIPAGFRTSGVMPVFGGNHLVGGQSLLNKSVAMGIHWMTEPELNEALPPAYTRHLGQQLKGLI